MRDPFKLAANRSWFEDDRVPPRRLQVTHHPERRVVVLSVWHEETCTATFQLPVADAPALIEVLVDSLATAARPVAAPSPTLDVTGLDVTGTPWHRVRSWLTTRLRRIA